MDKTFMSGLRTQDMDLPMYDLSTIAHATNNFSSRNKLGEGGFGPVYKGTLVDGQEIAVKRLSKSSGQGMDEFKNEVMLIAKLQHRNLVKLLGFCIHKDEKMLIYEYMTNKSLDSIIFDLTRNKLLDWSRRIHIIGGIARGLVYLHHDSRLRIIHRDIKASNILLDNELNPKISDFGLARMFGGDQAEANTNRVVGTYFGVLVLEIVSGKKNRGFCHPDQNLNLLGHAWILWTKGAQLDLIDECLSGSLVSVDVLRCIHVALLCVQQRPEDRPTMSSVVVMLGSENPLPQPKQPGFFMGKNPPEQESSSGKHESYSANEVTLTSLQAR
ncbi:G-type lectin S-receptor serine/threonine-protein kinase [Salix suchowensis]|nr:G-type lectin S-receptor serine/threonine-protein kinase [Salix suchowensis]